MNSKKIIVGIVWLFFSGASYSQELLTLEQAVAAALENNHDIKLEKYNVEVSENNVSRAISGQMPILEYNANVEFGYADAETEVLNLNPGEPAGPPLELEGTSLDVSLQPQITIPLFNGFAGKYTYQMLQNANDISQLQLENITEDVVKQTVVAYIDVARQQAKLKIDQENIAISNDRVLRTAADAKYGNANTVRRLQSEVDLKTDSVAYRNTILGYENAKRNLNLILGQNAGVDFLVEEDILLIQKLEYEVLNNNMLVQNTMLKLTEKNISNNEKDIKIKKAQMKPSISAYANYTYYRTEDEANFLQSNRTIGPNAGLRLSFPIWTGGAAKIQLQNSKISLAQSKTYFEQVQLQLETQLSNTYAEYINYLEQLRIEEANLETFETNYEKTREDYALGQVDASDLRTAQLNLSSAKNRINNLKYNVKQTEIQLLQISGEI
ncbi:MAG: TolC family protein [Bacteroidota bacterium]